MNLCNLLAFDFSHPESSRQTAEVARGWILHYSSAVTSLQGRWFCQTVPLSHNLPTCNFLCSAREAFNFSSSLQNCYGFQQAFLQPQAWAGEGSSLLGPNDYRKAHSGYLNMYHPAVFSKGGLLCVSTASLCKKYIIKYSAVKMKCYQ